jgi:hypothetical protein
MTNVEFNSMCISMPDKPRAFLCRFPFTPPTGCTSVLAGDAIEWYCCPPAS